MYVSGVTAGPRSQFLVSRALGRVFKEAELWWEFVRTLVDWRHRDCVLFHRSAWQLGWELDERVTTYRQSVGSLAIVSIDLNNRLMVAIFGTVIGSKLRRRLSEEEIGIFRRVDWDRKITRETQDTAIPSVDAYLSELNTFYEDYQEPSHAERVKGIFESPLVCGLMLMQEADREWAWTVLAACVGLEIYQPEGVMGSVKRRCLDLVSESQHIRTVSRRTSSSMETRATRSLLQRTQGEYSNTSLATSEHESISHLKKARSTGPPMTSVDNEEGVIVFFLHALTDMPNARITTDELASPRDYFEMTIKVLDALSVTKWQTLYKPHPASRRYKGDAQLLQLIQRRYASCDRIREISAVTTVADLCRIPNLVALSGRGSVSVEAAFMKIPVGNIYPSLYTSLGIATHVSTRNLARELEQLQLTTDGELAERQARAIEYETFALASQTRRFFRLLADARQLERNTEVREFEMLPCVRVLGDTFLNGETR